MTALPIPAEKSAKVIQFPRKQRRVNLDAKPAGRWVNLSRRG